MFYHEVSKIVFDGFQKVQRAEGEYRKRLFDELSERIKVLYAVIASQHGVRPDELEPPNLPYDALITGVAEEMVRDLETWIKEI